MTDCHIINPPLTQITNQYLPRHHLFPNSNPNPNLFFSLFRTNPLRSRHITSGHHCTCRKVVARRALIENFVTAAAPVDREVFVFSARPGATITHHARTGNSRATVNQPPSPSSRLCLASFLVHLAATTMAAPPELAGLPMSSPQFARTATTTTDNTRANAYPHLCSRLTLFLTTSTMETTIYFVQFHQHKSAAKSEPPLVAVAATTPLSSLNHNFDHTTFFPRDVEELVTTRTHP
ncbi:hypothetical protein DEO72_LG2g3671 [Vigna unguiculata]|uniref:Uncharacterized protein n=1 Tax=Vigna unguiculata TaxID=3917 RepID=A0A4D6L473_VIGUN|nr:hypothetical protein DEO72_LG2g3671 [Vigna unguiculata]